MHWRRKWQPTPVFLPGESQGWGSLVGFRLWGRTESDTTEATQQQQQQQVIQIAYPLDGRVTLYIQSEVSQKEKHQYSMLLLLLSRFSRV